MPELDLREGFSSDEEDETSGVKEPEGESEETDDPEPEGEEPQDDSPASEEPEAEEESSSEEEEPASDDDSQEKKKSEWDVDALQRQREEILKDISELRKTRRDLKQNPADVFIPKTDAAPESSEIEGVAPEDIAMIEKVIKAKGYVQKDELQTMTKKQQINSHVDAWISKHPAFSPDNDPDDKNWGQLQRVVSAYFKEPENPKDVEKMLDVALQLMGNAPSLPVKSPAFAAASKEKIAAASKEGKGGKTAPAKESKVDPKLLESLKGFTDEEKQELLS